MFNISIASIILSLALAWSPNEIVTEKRVQEKWLVDQNSSMVVFGETNINSFECALTSFVWSKNLVFYQPNLPGTKNHPVSCEFEIPVKSFDCGMQLMTSDLRKTLQSEKYPFMNIKLKAMSQLISNVKDGQSIDTDADIMLTGIVNQNQIRFKVSKQNNQSITLTAKKTIQLSDYHITPPTRFMGSVKVKDEMVINITMKLKKIS
ncbi:MAG TPA: hypothetical protein DCX89_07735 [Saprospirales bacterium]|nr:hypothetical protein [Saprospirales bacterium]HAY71768.1 hypothetical protein [Saprospirales bacterium]HRQ28771.1 hypothetical protein [Saprospiraceae bacterium]